MVVGGGRGLTRSERHELTSLRSEVQLLDADPEDLQRYQQVRRTRLLKNEEEIRARLEAFEAEQTETLGRGMAVRLSMFLVGTIVLAVLGAIAHWRFGLFDPALQGDDDPRPRGIRQRHRPEQR